MENTSADTAAKTISLTADEIITWSGLAGTDASAFTLAADGTLTFAAASDYETKASYSVDVVATDLAGNATTQTVTVNLTDVNDAPTAVGTIADQTAVINQSAWSLDLTASFADVDAGDTRAYSLTAGTLPAGLTLNVTTGVISGTPIATMASGPFTVTLTDSGGLSVPQTFNLTVVDAPSVSNFAVVDDNAGGGTDAALGKSGDALTFTVTMSEAVTVDTAGGTPSIAFDMGGTAVTATYVSGSGTTNLVYTAPAPAGVNATSATLSSIALNGGTVIGDVSSQPLLTATVGQTASYTLDNTAPEISAISLTDGAYVTGSGVSVNLTIDNVIGGVTLAAGSTIGGMPLSNLTLISDNTYTAILRVVQGADIAANASLASSINLVEGSGGESSYTTNITLGAGVSFDRTTEHFLSEANTWFDGADIDGDGSYSNPTTTSVATIVNKGTGGTNLTASGAAQGSLVSDSGKNNGLTTLRFDGVDDFYAGSLSAGLGSDATFSLTFAVSIPDGHSNLLWDSLLQIGAPQGSQSARIASTTGGYRTYYPENADHANGYQIDAYNRVVGDTGGMQITDISALAPDNTYRLIESNGEQMTEYDFAKDSDTFKDGIPIPSPTSSTASDDITIGWGSAGVGAAQGFGEFNLQDLIMFDKTLDSAQIIVVQNYVASKWGQALNSNSDRYAGDEVENGNHDFGVAGIAKEASADVPTTIPESIVSLSKNVDQSLVIADQDFLKDGGDAVFVGRDSIDLAGFESITVGGQSMTATGSSWYIDVTDAAGTTGGSVSLGIDLAKLGLTSATPAGVRLLYKAAAGDAYTEVAQADAIEAGYASFTDLAVSGASGTDQLVDGYYDFAVI